MKKYLIVLFLIASITQSFASQKYWIFFKDKNRSLSRLTSELEEIKNTLPERTLKRRAKSTILGDVIDEYDIPVSEVYLRKLVEIGIKPIVKSNWLNAVSAILNDKQRQIVSSLYFVEKIQPVARYKFDEPHADETIPLAKASDHRLNYGLSYDQNALIRIPEIHDMGFDGSGVIIGMLDTGYDYKYHEAFLHLKVAGEFDFINQDSVTQNEPGDVSSQHNHGTLTLSAIGGFSPGKLIGPAYGATFYLAKTEDIAGEYPAEEDYWVAGLEWLERNGADVVSSSLGYLDWYTYKDMDGATAVTTLAAEIAAQKGVVIVNSMGNEGAGSWYYMIAPADGRNVISVGAVNKIGEVAPFSSHGPTADGRIKPDVSAMGVSVYAAQANTLDDYRTASGTSLSCPLAAGAAALLLQAHPYLSPYQVAEALRNTASNAESPNNEIGWGIVDAYEALFYYGLFFSPSPEIHYDQTTGHGVSIKIFSKFDLVSDSLFLYYSVNGQSTFQKLLLSKVPNTENTYRAWISPQEEGTPVRFYFSARDISGDRKNHPYFAPKDYFSFVASDSTTEKNEPLPDDFLLLQNAPNPFTDMTGIKYELGKSGVAQIIIYNILGQQVKTIVDEFQQPGHYVRYWDGKDAAGNMVTSGLYFYQLKFNGTTSTKRLVFLGHRNR